MDKNFGLFIYSHAHKQINNDWLGNIKRSKESMVNVKK